MNGLIDFATAIVIFAGCALPLLIAAWALEIWWKSLPLYKRHSIIRKLGGK